MNIPSYIEDPSYRYKMPALQLRTEGRLNGVKTKIVNLEDVAKAIRVPPSYPLKFMAYELGAQHNDSNFLINGDFKEPQLRDLNDKFIEKYILCPGCHYPEMVIKVKKGEVTGSCNSCGWKGKLDNAHKLAAHIIKHPPKNISEFKDGKDKGKDKEKEEKDAKDGKDGKDDKKGTKKTDKDVKKKEETQEEEKTEKPAKKSEEEKPTVQIYSFKDNEDEYINKIREVYKKHATLEKFEDHDDAINEIITVVKNLEVPEEHKNKFSYLLFNGIFDINIAHQVEKNAPILQKGFEEFQVHEEELDVLMNVVKFMMIQNDWTQFEKYAPTILKLFYDEDLLSEEFLLEWYEGKHNARLIMDFRYDGERDKKFKAAVKQFIDWLQQS